MVDVKAVKVPADPDAAASGRPGQRTPWRSASQCGWDAVVEPADDDEDDVAKMQYWSKLIHIGRCVNLIFFNSIDIGKWLELNKKA